MARVIFEELAARLPRVHEKLAELAAEAIEHINKVEQQMLPEPEEKPKPPLLEGDLRDLDVAALVAEMKERAHRAQPGARCGGVLHAPNRREVLAKHFEREAAPAIEFARQISDPPGFDAHG